MVIDSDIILRYLIEASFNEVFHEKWIDGIDLCTAICNIFGLKESNFSTRDLTKALNTKKGKAIKYQIDVSTNAPVSNEHIGIFRQSYRPKKGHTKKRSGTVYAYYFVKQKGSLPIAYIDAWFDHIVNFTDLLSLILQYKKRSMIDNDYSNLVSKRQKIEIPEQVKASTVNKEKIDPLPLC